jgi:hypothetical protein
MPILDLQQRIRELGRIRIGETKPTSSGKTRPAKLDRFRLTSPSRELLEQVAQMYGGQVRDWQPQGGGPAQFEVYTTVNRFPILVPPQPISQWYEQWSGGGCKRRCDGTTETITDKPCLCAAAGLEGRDRVCKPTTRLNVVLRDVPGLGVWRLESHGYYAAIELPQAALFLAQAGGYIEGFLELQARRSKRIKADGAAETLDYMVPVIDVGISAAELLAGGGAIRPALGQSPQEAAHALTAGQAAAPAPDYRALARAAADLDGVRAVWQQAKTARHLDNDAQLQADLTEIGRGKQPTPQPDEQPAQPATPPAAGPSRDGVWMQIVAAASYLDWTTADLEQDFEAQQGVLPAEASVEQMQAYLELITDGVTA